MDGKWGYLSTVSGKIVIPAAYAEVWDFSEGLAAVVDATGKVGFINRTGEWILPMEYRQIFFPYRNGFLKVCKDEHWGLYDSAGKELFPIIYDDIYYDEGYDRVFINRNGVKQLVSVTGEIIEPFIVDRISPLNYIVEYNPDSTNVVATHPYLVEYESVIFDVQGHKLP